MQDYEVAEPDVDNSITDWLDFLRELLKSVGLKGK
jgi:hypothetical protein